MSIESLLEELVSKIDGATGAIVVDADGEAIGWYATDGERLRLRGAYVSVLLKKACGASDVLTRLGEMRCLVLEYEGASFVAQRVDDDCLVAVELSPVSNLALAMFRLGPIAAQLRREFAS